MPLFELTLLGKTFAITGWTLFGFVGNVLFTGRVLIQWIAAERHRKSVTPVVFWWMSLAGAVVLIIYAYGRREIPYILGLTPSLIPYIRNLRIYYAPDRPPRRGATMIAIAVALGCIPILVFWEEETVRNGWFYFGLLGNAIFGSRFFFQWVKSEASRTSHFPLAFWYLSLVGSVLLLVYAFVRGDIVFVLAFIFPAIPYVRNIMLIRGEQVSVSKPM